MEQRSENGVQPPVVLPMPDPDLVQELGWLGFTYVRYEGFHQGVHTGIFELLGDGEAIFKVGYESWHADPIATDENLRHAVARRLRRRRG